MSVIQDTLPACPCGSKFWLVGPASIGGSKLQHRYFKCSICNRPVLFKQRLDIAVLLTPEVQVEKFSDDVNRWVDTVLEPAWRDFEVRRHAAQKSAGLLPSTQLPEGVAPFVPPQIPRGLRVYLRKPIAPLDDQWERVERESTLSLPVPQDPRGPGHTTMRIASVY